MKTRTREHIQEVESLGKLEEKDNKTFVGIISKIFTLLYIGVCLSFLLTNNILLTFLLLCAIYITRYNVFKNFIKTEYIHPKLGKKNILRSFIKDRINMENNNKYYKNTQLEHSFLKYIFDTKIAMFLFLTSPITLFILFSIGLVNNVGIIELIYGTLILSLFYSPIVVYFGYLCFREYFKFRKIFSSGEVYILRMKTKYYYIEDNKIFFY